MRKLIGFLGKIDIDAVKNLVVDAYIKFNGVINPNNPSVKLLFSDRKIRVGFMKDTIALAHYNAIELNVKALSKWDYALSSVLLGKFNIEKANNILATFIVDTVLHELSHLDQDFMKYVILQTADLNSLENANSYRTKKFINEHQYEINEELGVEIDYSLANMVNLYYRDDPYAEFYPVSNQVNHVFSMITGYSLDMLNKELMRQNDITKVGIQIDKRFYNLYDPNDLFAVDQMVRYSFKKFGCGVPTVIQIETGEFVIASKLDVIGNIKKEEVKMTEMFIYNYVPSIGC